MSRACRLPETALRSPTCGCSIERKKSMTCFKTRRQTYLEVIHELLKSHLSLNLKPIPDRELSVVVLLNRNLHWFREGHERKSQVCKGILVLFQVSMSLSQLWYRKGILVKVTKKSKRHKPYTTLAQQDLQPEK